MNNNLTSFMSNRCQCDRYIKNGEEKSKGYIFCNYECSVGNDKNEK